MSNQYGQNVMSKWIREDVDSIGVINVLELILVSNYYGGVVGVVRS